MGVFTSQILAYSTNLGSFWRAGLPEYTIGCVSWAELQETMGEQVERHLDRGAHWVEVKKAGRQVLCLKDMDWD